MLQAVNGSYNIGRVRAGGYANVQNFVMGSIPSLYGYVSKADLGDEIGPNEEFIIAGTMAMAVDGQNPFNEPWNGGAYDQYMGFKMSYGADSSHYGWIRLDVSADGKRALIKDAASVCFQTQPLQLARPSRTAEWTKEYLIRQGDGQFELELSELKGITFELSELSGKDLQES